MSQEEHSSSYIRQQPVSQSIPTSHVFDHSFKASGVRYMLVQLLLFVSILYAAYASNPQLEPRFILTCGIALLMLLIVRNVFAKGQAETSIPVPQIPQSTAQPTPRQQPRTPNMSGVWVKDKAASDSMEPTMSLMQVNRLIRTAVRLVKGMELRQSGNSFEIIVLSGILWFKIKEQYPLTGEMRRYKRRDLRKGLHRGTAEKLSDGAICVTLEWDEPLGGIGSDVFYIPAPGLLYVDSTIFMQGQIIKYRTVYNKQ